MLVSPAFAQAAAPATGGLDPLTTFVIPMVAVFAIMYFLVIRPQRAQMKRREEMLKNIRRGDTIVTGGGIVAKVTKVMENGELEVQIAEQVKIRVLQALVTEVRVKGEPQAANTK